MTKLKIKDVKVSQILTRDELRRVLGGEYGSGSGTGSGIIREWAGRCETPYQDTKWTSPKYEECRFTGDRLCTFDFGVLYICVPVYN